MTCANCTSVAVYMYLMTQKVGTPYCDRCLPKFLRPRAKAGLMPTPEAWLESQKVVAPDTSEKKKTSKTSE